MKQPRILIYDIESTPNIGYTWDKWETNVIEFIKEWELLCVAYKWYGEAGEVKVIARPDFKGKSDKALTKEVWKLFNEADVLLAHNGNSFDYKKLRAKFIEHGLPPHSPVKNLDTKVIAKRQFAFNSNSLNDLGKLLKVGKKVPTGGFDLWLGCMHNDKESWKKMKAYNKQDVALLELVYEKLKAWNTDTVNLATFKGDRYGCPTCGSTSVQRRGEYVATTTVYQRLCCNTCGHWFKGPKSP